jgi:hypothetical protein
MGLAHGFDRFRLQKEFINHFYLGRDAYGIKKG